MNGQNVSVKLGDNLQHIGKQSRLIVHLQNKRNRFSFCIVMKRKNIIFVFIERASADSRFFRCLLHGKLLHIHQPFGLDDLQKDLGNRFFFDYIVLCFFFSHGNPLPLYSFQEIHLFSQERSYHIPTQYARNFFESLFRSQCFRRRGCFRLTKCERCFHRHLRRQKRLRRGCHHPSGFCASIHGDRSVHPCGL